MSEAVSVVVDDDAAAGNHLGQRLRAGREAADISLRELARRVNLSPSFISQVELGRATPSVGTLYTIVTELGLSLDTLMAEHDGASEEDAVGGGVVEPVGHGLAAATVPVALPEVGSLPGLQRRDDRPELFLRGVRWERLTPEDDPNVEFLRVTYPPGTESCPVDDLMVHGGREYFHILSGSLEVQVAFARQVLGAGDSVNFDSSTPHRLSNPFDEPCVAIWFVVGRN